MKVASKIYYVNSWKDKIKAIYLILIGKVDCVSEIILDKEFFK